jgi:uncharacterized protein HemY
MGKSMEYSSLKHHWKNSEAKYKNHKKIKSCKANQLIYIPLTKETQTPFKNVLQAKLIALSRSEIQLPRKGLKYCHVFE